MESRASLIDHSLSINERLNIDFKQNLDTRTNYLNNPELVHWYGKLRNEPSFADWMVIYSNYQKEQLIETNYDSSHILKIPIPTSFKKQKDVKVSDDKIIFLYVGNVNYAKGVKYLLDAWEQIQRTNNNSISLILAGDCFPEFRNIVNHLPNRVYYKGYLFEEQLKEAFQSSHVLVMPSCNDSFGMVITEALSYNMPIISSSNVGASEMITHKETGLIYNDPFSVSELKRAMEYFIDNPKEIERMSKNILNSDAEITRDKEIKIAEQEIERIIVNKP